MCVKPDANPLVPASFSGAVVNVIFVSAARRRICIGNFFGIKGEKLATFPFAAIIYHKRGISAAYEKF